MPPKINLLSFNIVFLQTEPKILHQYPVFFCCQRNLSLTLRDIQYERIVPLHIPDLPAKCQIAVILPPQVHDYIVVYLHKSMFHTLDQIIVFLCCCAHFNHPFVFIIIYPFFTATTNMRTAFVLPVRYVGGTGFPIPLFLPFPVFVPFLRLRFFLLRLAVQYDILFLVHVKQSV